ncbi:hypothetical protein SAMN05444392_11822 [Seinonella peptonophila]|uniref:Uncharacterized protein n=1 Tax=Seinonella peptonophila TaxID=112248 RepID=A0A1M5B4X7_9BACL|nr:hypothetical protein [Seinonella peptonophila]SHF37377.1 hypothetical protein SAMN05444392_11822 [Seinonella peptonophila]
MADEKKITPDDKIQESVLKAGERARKLAEALGADKDGQDAAAVDGYTVEFKRLIKERMGKDEPEK